MPNVTRKKIVCFGGGSGMPSLLAGLKQNPWLDVTAIVTMFDNGGSSGVLRDRYGILPPSDVMRCVLALSENEKVARSILLKRIQHETEPNHTGGNLLLFALEKVYGNYDDAVSALCQILSANGQVVPVTQEKASLCASFDDGSTVCGETMVDKGVYGGKHVTRLFLEPSVSASRAAIEAIAQADALIAGPGDLYTSILPNFLPVGIGDAIRASQARFVFITNLLTEGEEMARMALPGIVQTVEAVAGRRVDTILSNSQIPEGANLAAYAAEGKRPLIFNGEDPRVVMAELWTDPAIARHNPARLAHLVSALI